MQQALQGETEHDRQIAAWCAALLCQLYVSPTPYQNSVTTAIQAVMPPSELARSQVQGKAASHSTPHSYSSAMGAEGGPLAQQQVVADAVTPSEKSSMPSTQHYPSPAAPSHAYDMQPQDGGGCSGGAQHLWPDSQQQQLHSRAAARQSTGTSKAEAAASTVSSYSSSVFAASRNQWQQQPSRVYVAPAEVAGAPGQQPHAGQVIGSSGSVTDAAIANMLGHATSGSPDHEWRDDPPEHEWRDGPEHEWRDDEAVPGNAGEKEGLAVAAQQQQQSPRSPVACHGREPDGGRGRGTALAPRALMGQYPDKLEPPRGGAGAPDPQQQKASQACMAPEPPQAPCGVAPELQRQRSRLSLSSNNTNTNTLCTSNAGGGTAMPVQQQVTAVAAGTAMPVQQHVAAVAAGVKALILGHKAGGGGGHGSPRLGWARMSLLKHSMKQAPPAQLLVMQQECVSHGEGGCVDVDACLLGYLETLVQQCDPGFLVSQHEAEGVDVLGALSGCSL